MLDCARGRCLHKSAKVDSKCLRDGAGIALARLLRIAEQHRKIGIISDGPPRGKSPRSLFPRVSIRAKTDRGIWAPDTPGDSRELRCKGKAEK